MSLISVRAAMMNLSVCLFYKPLRRFPILQRGYPSVKGSPLDPPLWLLLNKVSKCMKVGVPVNLT